MKRASIPGSILMLLMVSFASAEPWKPVAGPLMTRWAKDVSPEKVLPEYPRPQMVRPTWLNLNGLWQLQLADGPEEPAFGKDLPMQILVPFPVESALSGVMKHSERLVYRRTFEVPNDPQWSGKRILLHFGAVDWEATVYVNGKKLGVHRGGYDGFSFDITDALTKTGPQELVVAVFDPSDNGTQPRGKQTLNPGGCSYTTVTGIWQTVWLEPVNAAHIDRLKIVPDVDNSCVRVTVTGNGLDDRHVIFAEAFLTTPGKAFGFGTKGDPGKEIRIDIPQEQLKLWSPDEPFLYDLAVKIREGNETIDEVQSYFGMRKIDLGKDDRGVVRMRLNGKVYFQNGPLDQGFWPDGIYTAPTDEALRFDIEKTKELGFNMIRKHMKVEPERWYYWCDKLGIVVWQDMPSTFEVKDETKPQFATELERMIEGRFNSPSIIVWTVFNESWGQHDTEHYVAEVKKWDPSRLINNASGWNDTGVGDLNDIHVYPGPACPEPDAKRAVVLGEFGGLGLTVKGHTWSKDAWGYRQMNDRGELTARYCNLLRRAYDLEREQGLSAIVYTQTTDVETECNGLFTYDREVLKVDPVKVAAANRGHVPKIRTLVNTSVGEGQSWRYTFDKPADDWFESGFDDSAWAVGPGGFGTAATPGAVVRTTWNTGDIWLRREVELKEFKPENLLLLLHHDEDAEVYINGVLAAKVGEFTKNYEECSIEPAARAALKTGRNIIAVHCKQTGGGQYIDLGLLELFFD